MIVNVSKLNDGLEPYKPISRIPVNQKTEQYSTLKNVPYIFGQFFMFFYLRVKMKKHIIRLSIKNQDDIPKSILDIFKRFVILESYYLLLEEFFFLRDCF
jgi:hypothetical protein